MEARRADEQFMPVPRHLVPLPTPPRALAQLRARANHFYVLSGSKRRAQVPRPGRTGRPARQARAITDPELISFAGSGISEHGPPGRCPARLAPGGARTGGDAYYPTRSAQDLSRTNRVASSRSGGCCSGR
jgi:hypothetical protein